MALPLYVSLEQIDPRLIEAARGSLREQREGVPPGDAAAVAARRDSPARCLTFIPAAGDFINAQLLGTPRQYMIGNVIQSKFLELTDYPAAAALSFILMALILVAIFIYARAIGTEKLTG